MLFINRFAKVTDDPVVQGAGSVNVIGVGRHEDCGNRAPCINEVSVEFDPGHRRHMDVSDQAGELPIIFITGHGDIPMSVHAPVERMKASWPTSESVSRP
jgi:hypothetical protein